MTSAIRRERINAKQQQRGIKVITIDILIAISAILTAIAYRMAWTPKVPPPEEIDLTHYYQPLFDQETLDELERERWQG